MRGVGGEADTRPACDSEPMCLGRQLAAEVDSSGTDQAYRDCCGSEVRKWTISHVANKCLCVRAIGRSEVSLALRCPRRTAFVGERIEIRETIDGVLMVVALLHAERPSAGVIGCDAHDVLFEGDVWQQIEVRFTNRCFPPAISPRSSTIGNINQRIRNINHLLVNRL
jgi:hypothetical protein